MARASLVDVDVEGGHRLVEALDRTGFPVAAAFWLYDSNREAWRLFIASPVKFKEGSAEAFRQIQSVMTEVPDLQFWLHDITPVDLTNPIVKAVQKVVHTGPGISGIRLTGNMIDGTLIEDAYIYRA